MKSILCIGGSGQLGSKVISTLSGFKVTNVDFKSHSQAAHNILLDKALSSWQNNLKVAERLKQENKKYHSIIVTAGGWIGGNIKDDNYVEKCKIMNQACLYPSILAAHLSTKYLENNGLVVFTGAAAVFKEPQPEMIAYALAKTAVHSLALNLAQQFKGQNGKVITILPQTIDTPSNREAMPTANFDKWSKPQQIGELLRGWIQGLNVPNNGSFVVLGVKNGCISLDFV